MKKLVFSSLNIDRIYNMERFIRPGETTAALEYSYSCGGKGFNLAMAMAKAGEKIYFAGAIGPDGEAFEKAFSEYEIDTTYLRHSQKMCGHAVVQVDASGQNCIIVVKGANDDIPKQYIDEVLEHFDRNDVIILQNEAGPVDYLIEKAHERGMKVAFNPSPINEMIARCDLSHVDYLFINEGEGEILSGEKGDDSILQALHTKWPDQTIVLTLGSRGGICMLPDGKKEVCGILETTAVDTTAAGDTFAGYFLAEFLRGSDTGHALKTAAAASGISVSRKGAAQSIPCMQEVRSVDFTKITEFKN